MSSEGESDVSKGNVEDVLNNYATPLAGTYLNLTSAPALIECPSCGVKDLTEVHLEATPWTSAMNKLYRFVFITLCCCCCFHYNKLSKRSDSNHYCKNCSCYLGRAKRMAPVQHYKGVRLANKYDQ